MKGEDFYSVEEVARVLKLTPGQSAKQSRGSYRQGCPDPLLCSYAGGSLCRMLDMAFSIVIGPIDG
jgi:hypothetical protein